MLQLYVDVITTLCSKDGQHFLSVDDQINIAWCMILLRCKLPAYLHNIINEMIIK